jgi:Fe-S-cluster-containing hydrogenase component 2
MNLRSLLKQDATHRAALVSGCVVPDQARCVQCGICSYNCPIGIDVRRHAWLGQPVKDSHCLTCGECVARCPRGVLRFERTNIFEADRMGLTE